jgi:predicted nucleic acid-binding protein
VFSAVLDACALFPQSLRDILLHLAEAELYAPLWSARILEEMERNVVEYGIHPDKVARTIGIMREVFEEAEVDADKIAALELAMTNDEKDRHVLAAAVAAGSEVVVTFNLRDFPKEACDPVGVSAISPDEFLQDLFDLSPGVVYRGVAEVVARLRSTNFDEFLGMLERAGVPGFVAEIRAYRPRRERVGGSGGADGPNGH